MNVTKCSEEMPCVVSSCVVGNVGRRMTALESSQNVKNKSESDSPMAAVLLLLSGSMFNQIDHASEQVEHGIVS